MWASMSSRQHVGAKRIRDLWQQAREELIRDGLGRPDRVDSYAVIRVSRRLCIPHKEILRVLERGY